MQQDGREKGHLSKYWWLKLIAGLILIVAGIVTLWYPAASYEALTLVFGIVIIISGIVQLTVGIDNPRYYYSRGWAIASVIIDIIIGIIFCA